MKKIFAILIVVGIIGYGYYLKTNLDKDYGCYSMSDITKGTKINHFKAEVFAKILDAHKDEVSKEGTGADYSGYDKDVKSDTLEKMEKGRVVELDKEENGKTDITTYVYKEGFLIKIKGDPNEITEKSYDGHIKFLGRDRMLLEYLVFFG